MLQFTGPSTTVSVQDSASCPSDVIELVEALAWPITVCLLALGASLLLRQPGAARALRNFARRIKRVRVSEVEVELTDEAARSFRAGVERAFGEYSHRIRREYARIVSAHRLRESFRILIESYVEPLLGDQRPTFRATIFVPDFLFEESLIQLLDYYPRGKGAGRRISFRFGICGQAWRLGVSTWEPFIPQDPIVRVEDWGMTREEASTAAEQETAFACVVVREESLPVAVLYFDSPARGAFGERDDGTAQAFVEAVERASDACGLTRVLALATRQMASLGPTIRLYEVP